MHVDLGKYGRINFTWKEAVLAMGLLVHGVQTELKFRQCDQRLAELEKTTKASFEELKCGNAGPPCIPPEMLEKK